jgi:membrane-bound serine protease (ClpP class)
MWIAIFYLLGVALLIIELFLPAHGFIGLVGLGVLVYGLYLTYAVSAIAGLIGLIVLAIIVPTGLWFAIKYWHRTPLGRRISPPNPDLTPRDRMPVEDYKHLVGRVGKSLTPLRPVGMCEFDGRRIECLSEHGMIERSVKVVGVRMVDRSLSVRAVSESSEDNV